MIPAPHDLPVNYTFKKQKYKQQSSRLGLMISTQDNTERVYFAAKWANVFSARFQIVSELCYQTQCLMLWWTNLYCLKHIIVTYNHKRILMSNDRKFATYITNNYTNHCCLTGFHSTGLKGVAKQFAAKATPVLYYQVRRSEIQGMKIVNTYALIKNGFIG